MKTTPYIEDILSQPTVLERALGALNLAPLLPLRQMLEQGQLDRLVITGMGASLYGTYPAWLILAQAGLPAYWLDAAELIYYARELITPHTLLWVASQSGRSAELVRLLTPGVLPQPKVLLALTNDLESPLAGAAQVALPIDAPVELTVSTRTYLNTLAISQLAAKFLAGQPLGASLDELKQATRNAAAYLASWQEQVAQLASSIGHPASLVVLGRGPSLAAAHTGALVQAEAAKYPALALHAAEFRHGPLELVHPGLTLLVLAGPPHTAPLNQRLAVEVAGLGGQVLWVDSNPQPGLGWVPMPAAQGLGLPLAEILPFQLLSVALAQHSGLEAGKFKFSGKITLQE